MQVFQFISIHKAALLKRLLKKTLNQDNIIILDLEDSLSDFDEKKSISLKEWGRSELFKLVNSNPTFFKNKKVGIRINELKSREFEKDIKLLHKISKIINLFCIVLPKIGSKKDVSEITHNLQNNKISYETLIPIIETKKGMKNISSIIEHPNISYVMYGHNDYSLDLKYWPFLEHDEFEFWEIVTFLIKKIESKNIQYIHTPIFNFLNESLLNLVFHQLQNICSNTFNFISINNEHTALINHFKNNTNKTLPTKLKSKTYSLNEKINKALYIKNLFLNKKRNFVIDTKTKKFISPHEHISAINFLEKYHEKI
jgi:citrate lyase beta subunit